MLEARVPDVFSVTGKSVAGLVLHVPTVGVGHGVDELLSSRSICEIIVSELITVPASIGTLLLEGDVSGSIKFGSLVTESGDLHTLGLDRFQGRSCWCSSVFEVEAFLGEESKSSIAASVAIELNRVLSDGDVFGPGHGKSFWLKLIY